MRNSKKVFIPLAVFLFISFVLSIIQIKFENPLLLAERFVQNGGWLQILLIALYGALVALKMSDVRTAPKWRIISWTVFSIVFFSQLLFGILFSDKFLMTGKLHLPIPAMILCGPVYRAQLSVMTILFLSTMVLTGPAWCSHLCYFGVLDAWFSKKRTQREKLAYKMKMKFSVLFLIILVTLFLRWFKIDAVISTLAGLAFGIAGIAIVVFVSKRKGAMIHCIMFCPIGTLVNYFRFVNPFRMYIDTNCSFCENCRNACKYDALSIKDLNNKKPGITCTLCGDCLSVCHMNSLKYKLFWLNPEISRNIYLFLSISIHSIFLALAKI